MAKPKIDPSQLMLAKIHKRSVDCTSCKHFDEHTPTYPWCEYHRLFPPDCICEHFNFELRPE
jgi:hypothetical protein